MRNYSDFFACEGDYPELDVGGAAERLSKAIQCRTVNDREHYEEFSRLQQHMRDSYPNVMRSGSFELIGHSVLITLKGENGALRPALFMSHQDVVPVVEGTEGDWTYPPYSGAIEDGHIWGRGALDIKNQVFGVLEAAEYLLGRGRSLERTVYLAFGEDEETFNTGAQGISDELKRRGVTLEFVLDEGGSNVKTASEFGAPDTYYSRIDLMEKGYADLELSVKSAGGHSSRPFGGTSLGRISSAIADIVRSPFPPAVTTLVERTFKAIAPYVTEEPLKSLVADTAANAKEIAEYCMTVPELFPYVVTTIAPTIITGSSAAPNVMPQNMTAVINFRLNSAETPEKVLEHCRSVVGDEGVSMRFLQANPASSVADSDGFGYKKLTETLGRYFPEIVFVPSMTAGATDAHCYEQICPACIRFSPFMADYYEAAKSVHGTNERISLRAYAQGIRVLIAFIENTCM